MNEVDEFTKYENVERAAGVLSALVYAIRDGHLSLGLQGPQIAAQESLSVIVDELTRSRSSVDANHCSSCKSLAEAIDRTAHYTEASDA